jgi:prepilin-type N-terminal cleavage/methylation domain-containing protein
MAYFLKSKKAFSNNKGFSIIEFIVVSSIIAIISSIVFPNWNSIRQDILLQREAYKVAQDIRRTLEMSLSAQEVTCSIGSGSGGGSVSINGYLISFDKNQPSKYFLYVDGGNEGLDITTTDDCSIGQVGLDENVKIENISTGASTGINEVQILFIPPNPEVKFFSSGSREIAEDFVKITLSIKVDSNKKRNIVVNKAGLVYVE